MTFPSISPDGSNKLNKVLLGQFVCLFFVVCALFILRRPDSITNPQFWAEDGSILFQGQMNGGGIAWLVEPYRGYLILNSKLIALVAAQFPVILAPLIYNLLAILIGSLACSLFVLPSYRYLVRSDALRAAVCLGAAGALYVPSMVDDAVNSQWYIALIGLLLLIRNPAFSLSRSWIAISAVIATLAALTNPILIVSVPLCLWQIYKKGNRTVACALLIGIVVQILTFAHSSSGAATKNPGIETLVRAVLIASVYKVVISSFLGGPAVLAIASRRSTGVFFAVAGVALFWLVWLTLRLDRLKKRQLVVALYLFCACVGVAMLGRGLFLAFLSPAQMTEGRGEQYFFFPGCILVFLVALTIESIEFRNRSYLQGTLFLVVFSLGFYENFRIPPLDDLNWRQSASLIRKWQDDTVHGPFSEGVSVPINPVTWSITLPGFFRAIRISGFPDHLLAAALHGSQRTEAISSSALRDLNNQEYIELPIVLSGGKVYRATVDLQSNSGSGGAAVASLLAHGRLDQGNWGQVPPTPVVANSSIQMEIRPPMSGPVCIHLFRVSGDHPVFTSISIQRKD